jgi:hypothetical protein
LRRHSRTASSHVSCVTSSASVRSPQEVRAT